MTTTISDASIQDISEALVKEYLTAHGYSASLEAFKKETNKISSSISSRRELAYHLGLKKAVELNKQKDFPFISYLEILSDTVSSKVRMIRAKSINQNKYIKSSTEKEESSVKPKSIPNAFDSNPASNSMISRPSKTPSETRARSSHATDIEIIEDLDLSDSEEIGHQSSRQSFSDSQFTAKEISANQDREITNILFPPGIKDFSSEWKGKGFVFQRDIGYGLIQTKGGPCGLIAAVQAIVLKHLMWSIKSIEEQHVRPTVDQAKYALISTFCDILWQAGIGKACLVLASPKRVIRTRITSEFCSAEYTSRESLENGVKMHFTQFCHPENAGNGLIQFLLSVILSKGVSKIKKDMDEWSESLIGKHSYCTQEMVNLLLYGKAISNLHDGEVDLGGQKLKGLEGECDIGQLSLFEHYDNMKIGSFGKNPRYPIFVVCSESHYTVLFGTMNSTPGTSTNSKFDLFYYDQLANQTSEIKLSIIVGGKENETRDLIPPLELCLATKWGKKLFVDWNGTEPLL